MKENKQPILSICIPTRNRWYSLQYTLRSIIDQDEFKSGDVEIVISDNASTDETELEIGKLCERYKNIRYFRNNKNIGAMENINKAYALGCGKYLWCLSSHAMLNSFGLGRIIMLLEKFNPNLLMTLHGCNNEKLIINFGNNALIPKFKNAILFKNQGDYFNFLGDLYFHDRSSFQLTNNLFSNMGCPIFSKEYYNDTKECIIIDKGIDFFNKNNFIHIFISYYNGGYKKILLDLIPSFFRVSHEENYEKYERLTSRNRGDSIYMKDAHKLTKYLKIKYEFNKNFDIFLKKYNIFWTKLYIIHKIPCINRIKNLFDYEMRQKIWNFIK